MPQVNLSTALAHAAEYGYAVGSFNVLSLDFLEAIMDAAEASSSPVILSLAEVHFPYAPIELIAPAMLRRASLSPVPVVVHLDHGLSLKTMMSAIRCGFTSVMYDASSKPFEVNIEQTRTVVEMAHDAGVSVEAELGMIGGAEGSPEGACADRDCFTDPDAAEQFVDETGVDALAVSVGNVHGFYRGDPELEFGLIKRICDRTGVPLVLHGGSGISDDDFRKSIGTGIRKINIFTEMSSVAAAQTRTLFSQSQTALIPELIDTVRAAVGEVVRERIRVFGSAGQAL